MIEFIKVAWPLILLTAPVIGAIAAFWQQTLQIRELRFKIRDLERREEERGNRIYKPSPEEIDKYSKQYFDEKFQALRSEVEFLKPRPATRFTFWVVAFLFLLLFLGFVAQVSKLREVTDELRKNSETMSNELNAQKEEIKGLREEKAEIEKLREENRQLKERINEKEKPKR